MCVVICVVVEGKELYIAEPDLEVNYSHCLMMCPVSKLKKHNNYRRLVNCRRCFIAIVGYTQGKRKN